MTGREYEDPRSIFSKENIKSARIRSPSEILGWPECYICKSMSRVLYPVVVEGKDKHICTRCLKEEILE